MRLTALRPLRITFSLITFFLVLYLFVEGSGKLGHEMTRAILFFQVVPSAITLFRVATAASLGFLLILVVTLLFGRIYCSFLCPLGTVMDFANGLRTRIRRKKRFRFMKPQPVVQYLILAAVIIPLFLGNLFLLNLLDPYSMAGRIFSDILRPVWYGMINLAARTLELFNNYAVHPAEMKYVSIPSLAITLVIFISVLLLAFFRGRWYCNAICPVGTVLGFISRFSLFRIRINEQECTSCGLCARTCKSGCIDMKSKQVDFSRCVACYNCFKACEYDGFSYSLTRKQTPVKQSKSRRDFLRQTATGVTTIAGVVVTGSVEAGETKNTTEAPEPGPTTPPGSLSIWNFTSACTACHLCISACPTKVLQPAFIEYGLSGILMPKMNYAVSYCNFDCIACTLVCPTEAIRSLTVEKKHTTQIGVSKFIKNICVVVEKKTACGACSEHCPTKAVEMVPYLGALTIPAIDEKLCVGCGACEHACPTRPIRAIYVEPNKYHRTAMKPLHKVNDLPEVKKTTEDFPF
jgi:ferredoxin